MAVHVVIDHGFSYKTLYAHMDKILAKKGQKIKRGDVIGIFRKYWTIHGTSPTL